MNLKTINFQSFFKIPVFLVGLLFIFLIIVITIRFANYKYVDINSVKNPNPESVIPPVETQIKENSEFQLQNISLKNAIYVEDMVYNWQNMFDIFAYNVNDSAVVSTDTTVKNQEIAKILRNPNKFSKGASDQILAEYGDVLLEECSYYKLDWRLVLAIIKQESAFVSDAVSHAGAYGFMQIMPKTGSMLEQQLQIEEHRSPKNNLIAGIYYYAVLVGRYNQAGDINKYKFALAAYNAGSGHVEDAMSIAYYNDENYFDWDIVKEYMKQLAPGNDSLHNKIWGTHPPNGVFANWKEPYNYVDHIIYYWEQYKKIYPLPEDNKKIKKKKKRSRT